MKKQSQHQAGVSMGIVWGAIVTVKRKNVGIHAEGVILDIAKKKNVHYD